MNGEKSGPDSSPVVSHLSILVRRVTWEGGRGYISLYEEDTMMWLATKLSISWAESRDQHAKLARSLAARWLTILQL